MDVVEHAAVFDANRREIVDVKEPPVVDLVSSNAPVREAVPLGVEQPFELVERPRLALLAVKCFQRSRDGRLIDCRRCTERREIFGPGTTR
jgi:hypothetical protein